MADAKTWFLATRPKTLTAAFVPVGVGTALAYAHGQVRPLAAVMALCVALFMQIGTNLANDYFDHKSGADNADRLGPTRVTQAGLIAPRQVFLGAVAAFGLAFVSGLVLVSMTGWPLLAVGVLSILCGFAYTGGPFPLGYNGLGDVFVFVFFGLVAVVGTYYAHTLALHPMAFWVATHVGVTAVALLVVNNLRDIDTDRAAGKNTLAVLLGRGFTRAQYVAMLTIAYLVPVLAVVVGGEHPTWLTPLLTLPLAVVLVRRVYTLKGRALNGLLAQTAAFQLVTGLLFVVGIVLSVVVAPSSPPSARVRPERGHTVHRVMLPVDASTKNTGPPSGAPVFHDPTPRVAHLSVNTRPWRAGEG